MTPEELLKLAKKVNAEYWHPEIKQKPPAYDLAVGYLALSVKLEEAERDYLRAPCLCCGEMQPCQDGCRCQRGKETYERQAETSRGEVVRPQTVDVCPQCGSRSIWTDAQSLRCACGARFAKPSQVERGEVVTACPRCGAQANQSERTGVNPAWTHLPGWRPWFCGDCKREYDEPAYWQRASKGPNESR